MIALKQIAYAISIREFKYSVSKWLLSSSQGHRLRVTKKRLKSFACPLAFQYDKYLFRVLKLLSLTMKIKIEFEFK